MSKMTGKELKVLGARLTAEELQIVIRGWLDSDDPNSWGDFEKELNSLLQGQESEKARQSGAATGPDELTLKWGTLKRWNITTEPALTHLRRYFEQPTSISAAMTNDTPEQKQAIIDVIQTMRGVIFLDWEGKYVTKEEALTYITGYGEK